MKTAAAALLLLSLAVGLAAAQPSGDSSSSSSSSSSHSLSYCLRSPPSVVYQSPRNPDQYYFVLEDIFEGGEADLVAMDATDCFTIAIPIADFITQLDLMASCDSDAASAQAQKSQHAGAAALGRRLQGLSAADMAALTHSKLAENDNALKALAHLRADRKLADQKNAFAGLARVLSEGKQAPSAKRVLSAAALSQGSHDTGIVKMAGHARLSLHAYAAERSPAAAAGQLGAVGGRSSSQQRSASSSSSSGASPQSNSCDDSFIQMLQGSGADGFAQSRLDAQWWYFIAPDLSNGEASEPHMGFCLANFQTCDARCMDWAYFSAASSAGVQDVCQLAGL